MNGERRNGAQAGAKASAADARASGRPAPAPVRPSRALLRFFDVYLHFFVKRRFHALRLAGGEHWSHAQRPLVVCLNHPSWWDPLISILLSRFLAPASDHYAPMDALSFRRYGVLRKVGLFPVEQGTARGAGQFLRTASHILGDSNAVLWVTPQGGFTDARTRPVVFRPGLDALLRRTAKVTVLPLALEYTFWDERLPEALGLLGEPLVFTHGALAGAGPEQRDLNWNPKPNPKPNPGEQVAAALARTQDALATLARRRDPALFTTVLAGAEGISGIYGAWQSMRGLGRPERPQAEQANLHGSPDADGLEGRNRPVALDRVSH